jgi:hypothetical protein
MYCTCLAALMYQLDCVHSLAFRRAAVRVGLRFGVDAGGAGTAPYDPRAGTVCYCSKRGAQATADATGGRRQPDPHSVRRVLRRVRPLYCSAWGPDRPSPLVAGAPLRGAHVGDAHGVGRELDRTSRNAGRRAARLDASLNRHSVRMGTSRAITFSTNIGDGG